MDKFLKIFLSGLISFLVLNAGIFIKAETPSSDPVEDWRKWEPKPPKETPQIIYEKGCQVKTIARNLSTLAGSGEKGYRDGKGKEAMFNTEVEIVIDTQKIISYSSIITNGMFGFLQNLF